MNKIWLLAVACACSVTVAPAVVYAQGGAAPELFGVKEVIVEYARFDDPKASESCGLSRERIMDTLIKTLHNTTVPAVEAVESRPVVQGVARVQLIPEVYSYVDENLYCVSWISLSAESHGNVVVPPIGTQRSVTVVYWRQHTEVASNQSPHAQKVDDVLQKVVTQFAQQYRIDQPPELPQ